MKETKERLILKNEEAERIIDFFVEIVKRSTIEDGIKSYILTKVDQYKEEFSNGENNG